MAKLFLSEFVEDELDAISQFIAFDNPDAADRFIDAAYETFQAIARTPGLGRARVFSLESLVNIRSFRVKGFDTYLIFYRAMPHGVEVLHVIHGARNLAWFWEGN